MYDTSLTLTDFDPELAEAVLHEERRQEDHVELIASENYASPLVMAIQNSLPSRPQGLKTDVFYVRAGGG